MKVCSNVARMLAELGLDDGVVASTGTTDPDEGFADGSVAISVDGKALSDLRDGPKEVEILSDSIEGPKEGKALGSVLSVAREG